MATKSLIALKAKLKANPLFWIQGEQGVSKVRCSTCFDSSTDGAAKARLFVSRKIRKVALYMVTNYTQFRTCDMCGTVYR